LQEAVSSFQKLLQSGDARQIVGPLGLWDDTWRPKWQAESSFPDPPTYTRDEVLAASDDTQLLEDSELDPLELRYLFSDSDLRLYRLALRHRWKVQELKEVTALMKDPTFKAEDISPTLHESFQKMIKVRR
jgi:hypothetical protein